MTDAPGETGATPTGAPPRPQRLTRSRDDRVLGGVAAGLGRHLAVDPVLVRLGFVVATLLAGIGVLVYVAGWLLIPEASGTPRARTGLDIRQIAGFAALAIGLLVVLSSFDLWVGRRTVWALGLIAIGGAVLWVRGRDAGATEAPASTDPAPPPARSGQPPGQPPAPPSSSALPTPPTLPKGTGAPAWPPPSGSTAPTPGAPGSPARRQRLPASLLGPLTLCALAVWGGVAAGLHALGVVDLSLGFVLAGALLVIGVALVVGARWGRARWLVVPAVAMVLVATAWSALDLPLRGGIGERNYRPASFAVVEDDYELGLGALRLDLRDLDFTGRSETLRASVGIGELNVWVPDGVHVVVDGRVSIGELRIFGGDQAGAGVDERVVRAGTRGGGTLRLELRGGIGSVKVLDADDDGGPR